MSKFKFHQRPFSVKLSLGFYFETLFYFFSGETSVFALHQMIMDDESVNRLLNLLQNSIQQILTSDQPGGESGLRFVELYDAAYTLTQQRCAMMMYTDFMEILTHHVITKVKQHLSVHCAVEFICKIQI